MTAGSSPYLNYELIEKLQVDAAKVRQVAAEPYWIRQAQGTTHETQYSYDAHIPMILMGGRVRAGQYLDLLR